MSFDSDLVLFLILQEHNGDTNPFSSGITIESQHNFQLLEILPGPSFHLRCNYQPKAVKGLKVIMGKGHPTCQQPLAVSFPQYGKGHDSESAD